MIINPDKEMFKEVEEFLIEYIKDNPTNYPISIFRRYTGEGKYIHYNTEQLTRNDVMFNEFRDPNIVEIWDYSLGNIELYKKNNILNVKYVPLTLTDDQKSKLISYNPNNEYDYDVVFIGWVNGRRGEIINELSKHNIRLLTISSNPIFGEERDKLISKSKILLNIHFNEDYNIFESIRCSRWLDIGKIVISENSLDNDERCYNVKYEDIVNKVLEILNKK